MKRKFESRGELDTEADSGNVDEFRDHLLEQDEFVRVVKCELCLACCKLSMIFKK